MRSIEEMQAELLSLKGQKPAEPTTSEPTPSEPEEPAPPEPNVCPECGKLPKLTLHIVTTVSCETLACKPSSGYRPFCTGLGRDATVLKWNEWTKDGKWNPPREWVEDWPEGAINEQAKDKGVADPEVP